MVIVQLECGHKIMLDDQDGKKARKGHMAYCRICQDIKKITNKY